MIRNEYQVTWELFKTWALENALKKVELVFSAGWLVLAIVIFVLDFLNGGNILYRLLVVFCIYRSCIRWRMVARKQYRKLAKVYNGESWIRRIYFGGDKIRVDEGVMSVEYSCSDIVKIVEKDNRVWLYAANKTVIRLYKDCFVDSTWEECKELIETMQSAS